MTPFSKATCPYCGNTECVAEWTDVGVGYIQHAPYCCADCRAVQIGAYDGDVPTPQEKELGWYAPGKVPEFVSSINGVIIPTIDAHEMYRCGLVPKVPFKATAKKVNGKTVLTVE